MYKDILVPLDGSELAESVFPHIEMLAKQSRHWPAVDVILLRVAQPSRVPVAGFEDRFGSSALVVEQAAIADKEDAEKYLAEVAERFKESGFKVRTELVVGNAADEILDYAKNHPVDLIAMATHGRSGISRWAYGSVASKVLREIATPLLLVTPPKK